LVTRLSVQAGVEKVVPVSRLTELFRHVWSEDKTGNLRINVTLRLLREAIVAMEKQ
jgi:hypothetical protein